MGALFAACPRDPGALRNSNSPVTSRPRSAQTGGGDDFLEGARLRPALVSGTSTLAARVLTSVGHAGSPRERATFGCPGTGELIDSRVGWA